MNGHLNIVTQSSSSFINFTAICDTAALTLSQDSSPLILYLLLHRNTNFHTFIMQDRGYEKLVSGLLHYLLSLTKSYSWGGVCSILSFPYVHDCVCVCVCVCVRVFADFRRNSLVCLFIIA
ncbi:unnamed protein product [Trichobilharzia regenti]|nr:unnamed protein product [Trichobilharzia regenti]